MQTYKLRRCHIFLVNKENYNHYSYRFKNKTHFLCSYDISSNINLTEKKNYILVQVRCKHINYADILIFLVNKENQNYYYSGLKIKHNFLCSYYISSNINSTEKKKYIWVQVKWKTINYADVIISLMSKENWNHYSFRFQNKT